MSEHADVVLVVEDNPLNMKLVKHLLNTMGCHVLEAGNGEDGMRLARKVLPDLILMDIELPKMDGKAATRLIKEDPDLAEIKIVALTAYAMENEKKEAIAAGFDGYLTKPFDVLSFAEDIRKYLPQKPVPRPAVSQTSLYGNRICVIDDDPLNVKLLKTNLAYEGYEVFCASDGKNGVDLVRQYLPDLVLMDIMMPKMDGYEATRILKGDPQTAHIPIILITALDGEDDKSRGLGVGADDFLNKPVNETELSSRVRSLVRMKEYEEAVMVRNASASRISTGLPPVSAASGQAGMPRVVVAESDAFQKRILASWLSDLSCEILWADDGKAALEAVDQGSADVLIVNALLPVVDGYGVCQRVKSTDDTISVQVLMMTGLNDLPARLKGLAVGADDYLVRPVEKEEFCARVSSLIKKKQFLDRLRKKIDAVRRSDILDLETGIYNRIFFDHFMELEMKQFQRYPRLMSLLLLDFKKAGVWENGNPVGTRLKDLASVTKNAIRDIDLVARHDETCLVVVMPYADEKTAVEVGERIRHVISEKQILPQTMASGIRMGLATYPVHGNCTRTLLDAAKDALHLAQSCGNGRIQVCCRSKNQVPIL